MENTNVQEVKMPITYDDLKKSLVDSGRPYDFAMIDRAYALAEKAHGEQRRRSGEPYICHPLSVAQILVELGMDSELHDHEGRLITLEYDRFFLVTVYTPNSQRGLTRLMYRMCWEEDFRLYLKKLDAQKPVIVCGDMNVAHQEIDLKNPKTNVNNAGFTPQERGAMTKLLDSGFVDTFRYLYPDATGRYSWWSYMFNARANNAGWRIDYFLVSDRIKDKITDARIDDAVLGSDHCPVVLEIDL